MMNSMVSNFSDLIQRVTSSCLLHPIGSGRHYVGESTLTIPIPITERQLGGYYGAEEALWDPDKMRSSDMVVITELKKLGVLRERFRRSVLRGRGGGGATEAVSKRTVAEVALREVVAPYEAGMEKMTMELKRKEAEVENLKEKLNSATVSGGESSGRKSRSHSSHQSKMKVNYASQDQGE